MVEFNDEVEQNTSIDDIFSSSQENEKKSPADKPPQLSEQRAVEKAVEVEIEVTARAEDVMIDIE